MHVGYLIVLTFPIKETKVTCQIISFFWSSWSHRLQPKKLHASMAVPAALVRVPSQRSLTPSVASVTSVANDKGDNEMIPEAVHRS